MCRPRPLRASGRVTTASNPWSEAAIAFRAGSAGPGVPAKTSLIRKAGGYRMSSSVGRDGWGGNGLCGTRQWIGLAQHPRHGGPRRESGWCPGVGPSCRTRLDPRSQHGTRPRATAPSPGRAGTSPIGPYLLTVFSSELPAGFGAVVAPTGSLPDRLTLDRLPRRAAARPGRFPHSRPAMHASGGFLPGGYRPYAEVGPQCLSAGPPATFTSLRFVAPTAVRLGRADYEINAPPTHDRGRGRRAVCHEGGRRLAAAALASEGPLARSIGC